MSHNHRTIGWASKPRTVAGAPCNELARQPASITRLHCVAKHTFGLLLYCCISRQSLNKPVFFFSVFDMGGSSDTCFGDKRMPAHLNETRRASEWGWVRTSLSHSTFMAPSVNIRVRLWERQTSYITQARSSQGLPDTGNLCTGLL